MIWVDIDWVSASSISLIMRMVDCIVPCQALPANTLYEDASYDAIVTAY